jgi:flagellar hook assembly protein FlgD
MAAFVDAIKVQIFDLSGQKVYEEEMAGTSIDWHTDNDYGEYLANGVYLYKMYAKVEGQWIVSVVKKLAILR